jgi:hypothetical protein
MNMRLPSATASRPVYGAPKKAEPLAMPADLVAFEKKMNWGQHHLEWHIERRWDSFVSDPKNAAYAKKMGWKKAPRQEGDKGNGLDFLAMHRAMIQILTTKFPQDKGLFAGWPSPPTNPKDPNDPVPSGKPMDPGMLKAIDTLNHLEQHLAQFPTDDDLGRFIQTNLGAALDPSLGSSGVHNYLHNRFSNPKSKIDIGDPTVNIQNQLFWRLHGWIDSRWTQYRALKGEKDTDADYAGAIKDAKMHMSMNMSGKKGLGLGKVAPAPASVRHFMWEQT